MVGNFPSLGADRFPTTYTNENKCGSRPRPMDLRRTPGLVGMFAALQVLADDAEVLHVATLQLT